MVVVGLKLDLIFVTDGRSRLDDSTLQGFSDFVWDIVEPKNVDASLWRGRLSPLLLRLLESEHVNASSLSHGLKLLLCLLFESESEA